MAAATATVALDMPHPVELQDHGAGKRKLSLISGTITIVGDYSTGGVSVSTDISKHFKSLKRVLISGNTLAAQYDYANSKVLLYGDVASAALGVLAEPNGVTLSSTAFDFIAIGY